MQFDLTPDQKAPKARAAELAQNVIQPRAAEVDRSEQYPWDNVAALTEAGFMGMTIPTEWGGRAPAGWTPFWWSRKWPRSVASPDASPPKAIWAVSPS